MKFYHGALEILEASLDMYVVIFYFFRFQGDNVVRSDPTLIVFDDLNEEVITIGAGRYSSCAVTASGKLFTWGYGGYGQLGHGDTSNQNKPKLVEALRDVIITQIGTGSAESYHSIAISGSICLFSCLMSHRRRASLCFWAQLPC